MSTTTRPTTPERRRASSSEKPIIVSPGFGGRGYVVVDGFAQLRSKLQADGVADVVLQGSGLELKIRRKDNGDLVEATPPRRPGTTSPA